MVKRGKPKAKAPKKTKPRPKARAKAPRSTPKKPPTRKSPGRRAGANPVRKAPAKRTPRQVEQERKLQREARAKAKKNRRARETRRNIARQRIVDALIDEQASRIPPGTPIPPPIEGGSGERAGLIRVLERLTPVGATLDIVVAEAQRAVWLAVGRIDFAHALNYLELSNLVARWEADAIAEILIGADRISQLRVIFHDPAWRGKAGNTFLSEMGPWMFLLGAMRGELADLGERYTKTTVPTVYIYFSAQHQNFFRIGP